MSNQTEREALMDQAAKYGLALVPMRITKDMDEVMAEEGWAWEDLLAAAAAITENEHRALAAPQVAQELHSDPMRELPSKDTPWTVDDWSTWSYQVGLKLDRFFPAIGHDNRTRIERAIQLLRERDAAPQPPPEPFREFFLASMEREDADASHDVKRIRASVQRLLNARFEAKGAASPPPNTPRDAGAQSAP